MTPELINELGTHVEWLRALASALAGVGQSEVAKDVAEEAVKLAKLVEGCRK